MPPELDWSKAHFLIDCVGMADRWMWSFEADETWFVLHGTPGAGLVPFRLDGSGPASLEEVLFIADCVAFDHDTPTVVRPSATTPAADLPLIDPVVPLRVEQGGLRYFDALAEALLMATEIRVGEPVELRYTDDRPDLLNFGSRFADLEEPLSLYAMATRQVDVLSEYLCLYRVLEWVNKDNGCRSPKENSRPLVSTNSEASGPSRLFRRRPAEMLSMSSRDIDSGQ